MIDVGNTATKIGVFDGKKLVFSSTYLLFKAQDLCSVKEQFKIERAILCTVALTASWIEEELKDIPFLLWNSSKSNILYPVTCKNYNKETLGRDRIAIAVGLSALYYGEPALAIAIGSCITYNLVDENLNFYPGAISPGLSMRLRAMSEYTVNLPMLEVEQNKALLKSEISINDTKTALLSGARQGIFYEIQSNIDLYREVYGLVPVLITGGDYIYFDFTTKNKIFANPKLVLIGLNEILEYNK